MRVVAGTARGRQLKGPASDAVRPTTDKVRGAIFNSLGSFGLVDSAAVLDLFAGTGACGIEALSRGASTATFVDKDRKSLQVVRENLVTTGFEQASVVVQADAFAYLGRQSLEDFDLAFVDPPYAFNEWESLLNLLTVPIVVCESAKTGIPMIESWESLRERRYGDTMVTILRRRQ